MPVPFRFDTVLRVREAERDRCRQALAQEQQREASLMADHQRVVAERQAAFDDLRQIHKQGGLPPDQELERLQYADHLAQVIVQINIELAESTAAVGQRRSELLEADAAVKALEKLAGRHVENQQRTEQANAERDRDDSWRAA